MKFTKEELEYINGTKFSNGKIFKVAIKGDKNVGRLDYLESISKGKNILHIGFADHVPLIQKKIDKGMWLHKRLVDVSAKCFGVDIERESVEYVREKFNIDNLYCLDIVNDNPPEAILKEKWDYMILGEVLEHIDNPVSFLTALRENYKGVVEKIIVTVPNAFNLTNFRMVFKHREFINTDHRFWFTPYTLSKVIHQAGLQLNEFELCQTFMPSSLWKRFLINRYPLCRETIIAIANL